MISVQLGVGIEEALGSLRAQAFVVRGVDCSSWRPMWSPADSL
jgi:hypothetical protein